MTKVIASITKSVDGYAWDGMGDAHQVPAEIVRRLGRLNGAART